MKDHLLKAFIFIFFTSLVVLPAAQSFAQNDSSMASGDLNSDEQTRDDQNQQTLNQIHELVLRMQENNKRLDALEKAVNQTVAENEANENAENPPAPVIEAPAVIVAPIQTVPIQQAPARIYTQEQAIHHREHTFELAQEDFYYNYREAGSPDAAYSHDIKKTGGFYGLYGAYTFRPLDKEDWLVNTLHLDVHGDLGKENYNYIQSGNIKNVNAYIVEPRVWVGHDFNFSMFDLTPYVGFGYRWFYDRLKNKFSDTDDDQGGNNIQTQYFYIPVGAQLSVRPAAGWRVDLNGEFDALAWGRITNYSEDFITGSDHIVIPAFNNNVRQGYGIRGSIKIVKEGDIVNYFAEPYIRYWNINSSNTNSPIAYDNGVQYQLSNQEYKNHTTEVGARAGVEF